LKIFVEMIDATNGEVCWADTYALTLDGPFTVEEKIARAVAGALRIKLLPPHRKGCFEPLPVCRLTCPTFKACMR
jgi:hypothetical protein